MSVKILGGPYTEESRKEIIAFEEMMIACAEREILLRKKLIEKMKSAPLSELKEIEIKSFFISSSAADNASEP